MQWTLPPVLCPLERAEWIPIQRWSDIQRFVRYALCLFLFLFSDIQGYSNALFSGFLFLLSTSFHMLEDQLLEARPSSDLNPHRWAPLHLGRPGCNASSRLD